MHLKHHRLKTHNTELTLEEHTLAFVKNMKDVRSAYNSQDDKNQSVLSVDKDLLKKISMIIINGNR